MQNMPLMRIASRTWRWSPFN